MLNSERTSFTLDVQGRYVCNTWQEAIDSTNGPNGRPFDAIVIGGGTFGSVFANHLFNVDARHEHRILVLEAGPFTIPEHTQNLPMISPGETLGVPWNSDSPKSWNREFPGLYFTLGGRSLYWGGWSPYFIQSEIDPKIWPKNVVQDLNGGYLDQAAVQIGSDTDNDFVSGPLQEFLRKRLFTGLKIASTPTTELTGNRGKLKAEKDLEAPLAVQSAQARPGTFPMNKFSGVPLLIRSARMASQESQGSDARKRLMVVGNTHVVRLERDGGRIVRIHTNQGAITVPDGGRVFLALGTIENTRLALHTLPNEHGLIGRNLMAHLRSNLTFRLKRSELGPELDALIKELSVAALFVKGIHTYTDGTKGHFHLQITASGLGKLGADSEAELWKKIPDIDGLEAFKGNTDEYVVITLRGIGEMESDRTSAEPSNRVTLDWQGPRGDFDYETPRALVRLEAGEAGSKNVELWNAMDKAAEDVAKIFAKTAKIQYLFQNGWQVALPSLDARRDKLSSTHHEAGTCWMGATREISVTDELGRFWECENLYALGPCLLPTIGSPNPMLSGVALTRRTVDKVYKVTHDAVEEGFTSLFDGTADTFKKWQAVGNGVFTLGNGEIVAEPGSDLGLLYFAGKQFDDFTLRLQFKVDSVDANSGVFVRFRDPLRPVPDRLQPTQLHVFNNKAFVAVETGYEVQIDELARNDGLDMHRTGAIYGVTVGAGEGEQHYRRGPALRPNEWNDLEIEVIGDTYTVRLRRPGDEFMHRTTSFTRVAPDFIRGNALKDDEDSGFVGIQSHTGRVAFRAIRVVAGKAAKPIAPEPMAVVETVTEGAPVP